MQDCDGGDDPTADFGGALLVAGEDGGTRGGRAVLRNAALRRNRAGAGGAVFVGPGASLTADGSVFQANEAKHKGGAIVAVGDVTLQNTDLTANRAYLGGALALQAGANATLDGCRLVENLCAPDGVVDAAVAAAVSVTTPQGGALFVERASARLDGCTVERNRAVIGGAAMLDLSELTSSASTFDANEATRQGGAFFGRFSTVRLTGGSVVNGRATSGGAAFAYKGGVELDGVAVADNAATACAALPQAAADGAAEASGTEADACGDGGGLYLFGSTDSLDGGALRANSAERRGGGLYAVIAAPTLRDVVVERNTADEGGGLYAFDAATELYDVRLLDNFATQNGGGFFGYAGTVRATGGEALGNAAAVGGGFNLLEMTEAVLTEIELANSRPGVSNFAAAPADATAIDIFARDVGDDGSLSGTGGGGLSAQAFRGVTFLHNASFVDGAAAAAALVGGRSVGCADEAELIAGGRFLCGLRATCSARDDAAAAFGIECTCVDGARGEPYTAAGCRFGSSLEVRYVSDHPSEALLKPASREIALSLLAEGQGWVSTTLEWKVVAPLPPPWATVGADAGAIDLLALAQGGKTVIELAMLHSLPLTLTSAGLEAGFHNGTVHLETTADSLDHRALALPFTLYVTTEANANTSTVGGPVGGPAIVGSPSTFEVQARDSDGFIVPTRGDPFAAFLLAPDPRCQAPAPPPAPPAPRARRRGAPTPPPPTTTPPPRRRWRRCGRWRRRASSYPGGRPT